MANPSGLAVCLIGPGALSSNPRLVKEADALAAAGYRLRVVCGTGHSLGDAIESDLLAGRRWSVSRVPSKAKWQRAPRVLLNRGAARLAWSGWLRTPVAAAWAESEIVGRLARAAATDRADLYIGHYLPGLYAARKAASRYGTAFGFDAEDSHVDEFPDTREHHGRREARTYLERRLLAQCSHLTASSPQIADAYERRYGRRPLTVLNVFPLSEAPSEPVTTPYLAGQGGPTLYWFSQTVGPGRGLEEIVTAMGQMSVPAVLHLLGNPAQCYQQQLEQHANSVGVQKRLVWHPPADPGAMIRLAASYDLGLALERNEPPNRAICLTNKAFTYLLAGVPVVLSRTPAQEWLARQLGEAALPIELRNSRETAARLDAALLDRAGLASRRLTSWRFGRTKFNWDMEREKLLDSVRQATNGIDRLGKGRI